MNKPMYNRKMWILCQCSSCGRLNYVEQHGITGPCKCSPDWVEHESIPYQYRDKTGMRLIAKPERTS